MAAYSTIDYLPDLTSSRMQSASQLTFAPYTPTYSSITWDSSATYYTSQQYAILYDTFRWTGKEGATYDIFSSSYFDPYLIQVYDDKGNVIAVDTTSWSDTYGYDYVWDFVAPYSGTYYVSAGWNQGSASTNRFVSLSVYEDVGTIPSATLYGTVNGDTLNGTAGPDVMFGEAGNDVLNAGAGNDVLDGGSGVDTVLFSGPRANFTIEVTSSGHRVTDSTGREGVDTLSGIERLKFTDKAVAFDIDGTAGKLYRLYQAAFDRVPDLQGLGYWINSLDVGYSMQNVASGFYNSSEFKGLYGASPSNFDFLTRLYNNILNRAPDQDGFNWWLNVLDRGLASQQQVLIDFSDSAENRAQVIGSIQGGIEYTPWAG
jgi:serralysin